MATTMSEMNLFGRWQRLPSALKCLVFSFFDDKEHRSILWRLDKTTRALSLLPGSFSPTLTVNNQSEFASLSKYRIEEHTRELYLTNVYFGADSERFVLSKVHRLSLSHCQVLNDNLVATEEGPRELEIYGSTMSAGAITRFLSSASGLQSLMLKISHVTEVSFLTDWQTLANYLPKLACLHMTCALFENSHAAPVQWPSLTTVVLFLSEEDFFPDFSECKNIKNLSLYTWVRRRTGERRLTKRLPPALHYLSLKGLQVCLGDLSCQPQLHALSLVRCGFVADKEVSLTKPLPLLTSVAIVFRERLNESLVSQLETLCTHAQHVWLRTQSDMPDFQFTPIVRSMISLPATQELCAASAFAPSEWTTEISKYAPKLHTLNLENSRAAFPAVFRGLPLQTMKQLTYSSRDPIFLSSTQARNLSSLTLTVNFGRMNDSVLNDERCFLIETLPTMAPNLEHLTLRGCGTVRFPSRILPKLKTLTLAGGLFLSGLFFLSTCPVLHTLDLSKWRPWLQSHERDVQQHIGKRAQQRLPECTIVPPQTTS